jgi:hypothetical protein
VSASSFDVFSGSLNVFSGNVPTISNANQAGTITFKLGKSVNDPNAIVFGDETNPLVGSLLEIPARVESLGGVQNHAIHMFPGGFKTVQALGAFPHTLQWDGLLLTGNASARSFQLDTWRRTGQTAYLALGPWLWRGIVTSYVASFMHQNYVRYQMSFEPTVDLTASPPKDPFTGSSMNSLLQQINAQGAQTALSQASLNALVAFSQTVTSFVQQFGISGPLTTSQLFEVTQAQATVIGFLAADSASTNLATSLAAGNMTGVVNNLVAGLSTQSIQTTLTLINPNLATLASQYLGDASRWSDIAALNGLSDIEPAGLHTLSIPSL